MHTVTLYRRLTTQSDPLTSNARTISPPLPQRPTFHRLRPLPHPIRP